MPVAKASGGDFEPAPAGTHLGRCIGCVSLGTQPQTNPQFAANFKVMLIWELSDELVLDDTGKPTGKAMTVHKEYTCSLGEKANLRHMLESWRGRPFTAKELEGFDVSQVVDHPCMITVIHKQSAKKTVYADVSAVTKLPKSVPAKPRVNELVRYEIEHGKNAVFLSLPEWIRKKIAACLEWTTPAPAQQHSQEGQPEEPPPEYFAQQQAEPEPEPEEDVPF